MSLAFLTRKFSPDPHFKVGACIVDEKERVVAHGYNSMPNKCEGKLPWSKDENIDILQRKTLYGKSKISYSYFCLYSYLVI